MRERRDGMTAEDLDRFTEEIVTDAYGDDEQLWAFRSVLQDGIERTQATSSPPGGS